MWGNVHRFDYNQQDRFVFNERKYNFRLALMYFKISFYHNESGLVKNNADIIDNGVHNFDFAHDHDVIQAQECAQKLTNSILEKKYKNGGPLQFDARTSPVFYTTSDTSKIQLLKLCSQADVPLYFFESVLEWAAASSKAGVDFSSGCQTQDKYLTELSFRYKMEQLRPIQRFILLSDGITVIPVTCLTSWTKSAFWMTNGS
jgi:hypothetical protein